MSIIEVSQLSKTFKTFQRREGVLGALKDLFVRDYQSLKAVDQISFNLEQGELLGYIGPNGAGKSTSIKMLTGILSPSSGSVSVMGFNPFLERREYTRHIGVVFGQRTQLWWDIAVIESFNLLAKIYGVEAADLKRRLDTLIEILDLSKLLHTPVRKLSLGQRIRCDLASSLLHDPKILFLDEPTIGLDAVGKDSVRSFLRQINRDFGTTIILTTHDLREIEELCKRIIVIDHGKIIFDGALERIRNLPGLLRMLEIEFPGPAPLEELSRIFSGSLEFVHESERRVTTNYDPQKLPTPKLIQQIVAGFEIADLSISEPDIEDIIMKIYREGLGDTSQQGAA